MNHIKSTDIFVFVIINGSEHVQTYVVIKILQGSAVTLTMLGGLTIYPPFANFLQCICAKNYENWLAVDKVIAKIIRLIFWPTLCVTFEHFPCKNSQ